MQIVCNFGAVAAEQGEWNELKEKDTVCTVHSLFIPQIKFVLFLSRILVLSGS
jgi:hypothetical protein